MLPIVLTETAVNVGLAGAGAALERRRMSLAEAGIEPVAVAGDASLEGLKLLYIAGLPRMAAEALAAKARAAGILVNVEDVPVLCDFHAPAVVRRGDLLVTVSTGGRAPGLAKLVREWISRKLGAEWSGHLDAVSRRRATWRADGHAPEEVSRRTREFVSQRNWLA